MDYCTKFHNWTFLATMYEIPKVGDEGEKCEYLFTV